MPPLRAFTPLMLTVALLLTSCGFRQEKSQPEAEPSASFSSIQRSVLASNCIRCHNPGRAEAGIDLTTYDKILAQPGLVVPGDPESSNLYRVVADGFMPPVGESLSDAEIALIEEWIAAGAAEEIQ